MLFDWNHLCTHPHKQKQNSQQLFLSSHPTLLYPPLSPISERRKPLCVCVCSHLQVPDELSHGDLLCHPMVEAMAIQNHALEDGQGALQDGHVHHRLVDVARNLSEHRENRLTQRNKFCFFVSFLGLFGSFRQKSNRIFLSSTKKTKSRVLQNSPKWLPRLGWSFPEKTIYINTEWAPNYVSSCSATVPTHFRHLCRKRGQRKKNLKFSFVFLKWKVVQWCFTEMKNVSYELFFCWKKYLLDEGQWDKVPGHNAMIH